MNYNFVRSFEFNILHEKIAYFSESRCFEEGGQIFSCKVKSEHMVQYRVKLG